MLNLIRRLLRKSEDATAVAHDLAHAKDRREEALLDLLERTHEEILQLQKREVQVLRALREHDEAENADHAFLRTALAGNNTGLEELSGMTRTARAA